MHAPRRLMFVAFAVWATSSAAVAAEDPVDFDRDIRPILSDVCYQCHGPDAAVRQADLRLDKRAAAFAEVDGNRIIAPGRPDASELYRRIAAADADMRMPPPDADRQLTAAQIELIRRWIEAGAEWEEHWAFQPPQRPPLPAVKNAAWGRNGIDAFILNRLEAESLAPAPEAPRTTLIRRVTLDLTGLPPTPAEVDAFLADDAPGAYERLVDRLLSSPSYGERMATPWLDAARYADTSGYQNDGPRQMWRWRDWVISAYNANMPFDQFTIEQLAGDLLPNATLDQRIATGFNRNHRGNAEGGIIAEEFQVEYVVDRVETTFTVWMGLTMGCARCHDHKYDPLSQRDFYRSFALFNNIPENGRAIKEGNSPPYVVAPTREQQRHWTALKHHYADACRVFNGLQPEIQAAQTRWEASLETQDIDEWSVTDGLRWHYTLDGGGQAAVGDVPPAKPAGAPIGFAVGRLGSALQLDGSNFLDAGEVGRFGYFDKFSLSAWFSAADTVDGTIASKMTDSDRGDGYQVRLSNGRIQVHLVKRWLDDSIRVETKRQIEPQRWYHLLVVYDGSRLASGITVYLDGRPLPLKVHYDFLNQSFANDAPFRIGSGGGPESRFRGLIDDLRVYDRALSPEEAEVLAVPDSIAEILRMPPEKRSPSQSAKLRACFLSQYAPARLRAAAVARRTAGKKLADFEEQLPTVMVMQEMDAPRPTHVLLRGQYDQPGERVSPAIPKVFAGSPDRPFRNRLDFARWLTEPAHPLTARVAVNRYWQMSFGTGLVQTAEDFGSQGSPPTHPELLDWLATEFLRSGWNVKALRRLIVTSAAYRQSSSSSQELQTLDPENHLLARGPRFRLSAQAVRDQALAAAGVLTQRIGGPSVKPYQPDGLWKEIATDTDYRQDHGPELYRRSLYTYWKRTVVNPTMATFDASPREACTVRRPRTNTPLQALAVLNDVTFVESARLLAQRAMLESDAVEDRIQTIFRLVLTRNPQPEEIRLLSETFRAVRAEFRTDTEAAEQLLSVGDIPRDASRDPVELAAYTAVCNLVMNLDEVLTIE